MFILYVNERPELMFTIPFLARPFQKHTKRYLRRGLNLKRPSRTDFSKSPDFQLYLLVEYFYT